MLVSLVFAGNDYLNILLFASLLTLGA
jgi:hypothetical protein